MRAVVQRIQWCKIAVDNRIIAETNRGILVYLAVKSDDGSDEVKWLGEKIVGLRIFNDQNDKMNLSIRQLGLEVMVVSQFTLYGDCRKGRRPSWNGAAAPEVAEPLYRQFIEEIRAFDLPCRHGRFAAHMSVSYCNDGPVTLVIDTP